MEFFRQLIEGTIAAWGKLNASARVNIALAAAAVVVAVVLLVTWGSRPNYVVLYSNLGGDDITKIVSQLRDKGIPYQVAAGGTAIRVPSGTVYELRNELAVQGLPTGGGVGFEIFDRTTLGATDFVQRVNYERALNTELARTISALDDVRSARVRVTLPEEALFAEEQKEPSASVLVALARPGALRRSQVDPILHLVAAGVEGLRKSNIAVVDTQGNVLATPTDDTDSAAELTNRQRAAVIEYERYLEDKARQKLRTLLGARGCVVTVSATLDFDEIATTEITYGEGVPLSEETLIETTKATQALPRGAPGVVAGVPAPGAGTPSTSTDKSSERTVTTSKVPEIHTATKKPPGTVKKLVVAALIEGTYQTDEESGEKTYVPPDTAEMEKLREFIGGTVGLDETRGDQLKVSDPPFAEAAIEAELPGPPWHSGLPVAQIVLGGAALAAFVVLRRTLSKMAAAPGAPVSQLEPAERYEASEEMVLKEKVKEQITHLSKEQPEAVAGVLKTWLSEEE